MKKLFWHWMNERHAIYVRRDAGLPRPWTKDAILDKYKFTNVYRQFDHVTLCWRNWLAWHLSSSTSSAEQLLNLVVFRTFNHPQTAYNIGWLKAWNATTRRKIIRVTDKMRDRGEQIFTGAYIVPNLGRVESKVVIQLEVIDPILSKRDWLANEIRCWNSMEFAWEQLTRYKGMGPFLAYELVCDMRYMHPLLRDPPDRLTWANPGPGARRGLNRYHGRLTTKHSPRAQLIEEMHALLMQAPKHLKPSVFGGYPELEMREIEHSLCEYDKYMRVLTGDGRPRSLFKPRGDTP